MATNARLRKWPWILALGSAVIVTGCARTATLQKDATAAAEPTAAWTKAYNAGDAAALAALYADDARSLPPGGPALTNRNAIETYWKGDVGEGGATTTLTPVSAVTQGDLMYVDGEYTVNGADRTELAAGEYQQLWARANGQWQLQREMWRIDPALHRDTDVAQVLTESWTKAYNAADPKALLTLYSDDAALSTVQEGTVEGKAAIEAFWVGDLGKKPESTLTVTDVYMTGELAHLEGEYKVVDSGKVTNGRYIQLWMREPNGWRIHREMWWR
jgi:uncharacterized protein (TIGR02246 family)